MALSEVRNLAAIIGSNAFVVGKVRGCSLFLSLSHTRISCLCRSERSRLSRGLMEVVQLFYLAALHYTLYTRNDIAYSVASLIEPFWVQVV